MKKVAFVALLVLCAGICCNAVTSTSIPLGDGLPDWLSEGVYTAEEYESGNFNLQGNMFIEFEGDTYKLVTGYEGTVYFYLFKQVNGTKQLLIPLGNL